MECKFSERIKNGTREYLKCTLNDDICPFIRYCINERKVINTIQAYKCKRLNKYQ